MSDNPRDIVQQIRAQFESILARVQVRSDEPPSAYIMERRLVTEVLALGRLLLECFYCSQQASLEAIQSVDINGERVPLHGLRQRSVVSVFGKIRFMRGYYYGGEASRGYHLLDARLNMPKHSASDLLMEWRSQLACDSAFHKTVKTLYSILGQRNSARAIEDDIVRDFKLPETFYEQQLGPKSPKEASILVVQADGKGVPMVVNAGGIGISRAAKTNGKSAPTAAKTNGKGAPTVATADGDGAPTVVGAVGKDVAKVDQKEGNVRVRLGKGEKSGCKKEAIAAAVYAIEPCIRTPEQVIENLFKDTRPGQQTASPKAGTDTKRKGPYHKWLWATFKGKPAAIALAKKQAVKREGEHITARVALTDGAAPLQHQMVKQLPDHTLILDIIHASEYLWKAGNGVYGETSLKRDPWVKEQMLLMLSGKTQQIIDELRKLASAAGCTRRASRAILGTVRYYERNLPYMRYDLYLEKGWPIGTGVIEGACRHLIKDRCELSGMRWTIAGAEALLQLRSIAENDDWEEFETYRQKQRQHQLYGDTVRLERRTTIEQVAIEVTDDVAKRKAA